MLLLLTILLVLVAAITLVIGIFSDQLALIWVSIAASFAAAVVLAFVSQMSKRRTRADAAPPATTPTADAAPVAEDAPTAVVSAVGSSVAFPLANYDDLKVTDIIPKLEGLSLDDLETVAVYEEDHKNRTTILGRIDELMDELEGADAPEADEPVAAATSAADGGLPIGGYDDLSVSDIIPRLDSLDADELEEVAVYEERTKNRVTVLNAIDDRLDILEGIASAPATPAKKAPAKKAPAKKAPAKKSTATKAVAKKAAAKKSTATKAVAKKAVAKKAPAKKSTATKAVAKKAPAKKSTTTKAVAKKAPAKTAKKSTKKR